MLYIKFAINDAAKFTDFQQLYAHMEQVRQPGFRFEEEEKAEPDIDWANMTQEEIDEAYEAVENSPTTEEKRYQELIPDYVKRCFERYAKYDEVRYGMFSFQPAEMLNYLEYGFETALVKLEMTDSSHGLFEFAPYGYPFGGLDRFLMTLRGYELTPLESYNGFEVIEFEWSSEFDYTVTEFPERTKAYKATEQQ
ncbi:MAG: hypothetical protein R8G66_15595 [Cytophagales bacterium]|nr:hypothetical protein [Cytophagales bacterium]